MPYVNNQGIKIHYEVEGDGIPLLFVHGLFQNWKWWLDLGYVDVLKQKYANILVDLRGHGLSDKPHNPELYDIRLLVSDLVSVLDDLQIEKAHYWGYSWGGWIGFGTAKYAPERFHSFILGGWQPYKDNPFLDGGSGDYITILKEQGMAGIVTIAVAELEKMVDPVIQFTDEQKADALANDVEAIINILEYKWPDFEDALPAMTMPCLIYSGDEDEQHDGAKACVSDMPNATFVSLSGLRHVAAMRCSEVVLPHIIGFLSKTKHS